nr:unnamed protein product [Callosobruchus analis]
MNRPKLKRFAVPSLNLPKRKVYLEEHRHSSLGREEHYAKRQKVQELQDANIVDAPLCDGSEEAVQPTVVPTPYEDLKEEEKVAVQNLLLLSSGVAKGLVDKEVQVSSGDIIITFSSTIKEDRHLNSLTGIPSFTLLNKLALLVNKNYPDIKKHKLSIIDRIVLVFMKLKMGLKFNVLSFLFKICSASCKIIFVEYVGKLANILKSCIVWPSYEECQQNIPSCFIDFKSVRTVLDCIEIPIEKPKCLCCRIRTYSHYKGRQTLKIMTGVSPAGLITFLSKSYGGRTSDKAIFEQSHLINKLQSRQDSLMVDKGFLIDKICKDHFIKLVRPHFLSKKKSSSVQKNQKKIFQFLGLEYTLSVSTKG